MDRNLTKEILKDLGLGVKALSNRIKFIKKVTDSIESNMFPVLNKTNGSSLHHELNMLEVFNNLEIPNIIGVVEGSVIKKECKDFISVEVDIDRSTRIINAYGSIDTLKGKEKRRVMIPIMLLTCKKDEVRAIIYNTFIFKIDELTGSGDYSQYIKLLEKFDVKDKLKKQVKNVK